MQNHINYKLLSTTLQEIRQYNICLSKMLFLIQHITSSTISYKII